MSSDTSKQLTISFEQDALVSTELANGHFLNLLELELPEEKLLWDKARAIIGHFSAQLPNGLAFVVRRSPQTPVQELSALKHPTSHPCILTISGRGADIQQVRGEAAAAVAIGFTNFLAVTGDIPTGFTTKDAARHTVPCTFTDSLDILSNLNGHAQTRALGATVNVCKYQPETVLMNYAKMFAKMQNGASFLIAQAGWDMAKYQELQWILQMRDTMISVIPRIRLFTPQDAQKLPQSLEPGVSIPVPVASKLMQLADEPARFYDYQRQMTALLAVGFRKLGFAGTLFAGMNDIQVIQDTLDDIAKLDAETFSYDDWLAKWLAFNGEISMAPAPSIHDVSQNYYLFSNLLHRELPFFTQGVSKFMHMPMAKPPRLQEIKCRLLAPRNHSIPATILKAILRTEATSMNGYALNNASCPKRLRRFPCGNIRPDGYCEADHAPCFFNQIARLTAVNGDISPFGD